MKGDVETHVPVNQAITKHLETLNVFVSGYIMLFGVNVS